MAGETSASPPLLPGPATTRCGSDPFKFVHEIARRRPRDRRTWRGSLRDAEVVHRPQIGGASDAVSVHRAATSDEVAARTCPLRGRARRRRWSRMCDAQMHFPNARRAGNVDARPVSPMYGLPQARDARPWTASGIVWPNALRVASQRTPGEPLGEATMLHCERFRLGEHLGAQAYHRTRSDTSATSIPIPMITVQDSCYAPRRRMARKAPELTPPWSASNSPSPKAIGAPDFSPKRYGK